ncbi:MAG: ethanolamine ammonia-lyase subunit EutB [Firmicutes bacterium]|nr:ethanolamine ammonia-lyase subunit EutB [Bacillota bacterium]
MLMYKTRLLNKVYQFADLKEVLAKANEEKSGDKLAGIAASSMAERVAAKIVLSELLIEEISNNPVIRYETDEVTRVIQDGVEQEVYNNIKNWTIAELREYILDENTKNSQLKSLSRGLTSEVISAVTKLMSNLDLIYSAKKIEVITHCNTEIGERGRLSSRLQPNHPKDDLAGVLASVREGLSYGIGDAVIGINPVADTVSGTINLLKGLHDFKEEWSVPTQVCVLAHINSQLEAVKQGAPADLIFQSIAGSEKGNDSFGVNISRLDQAQKLIREEGTAPGPNLLYFETGQGSELSAEAHFGVDQLTMEARCYGLARCYQPFLVNTVVGFIGPEYLYDSKQVIRAGLEDHFMGKLSGLPMGVDVCYTNHMKADQNDIENLAVLLTSAGCNYFIGIPHGDDVMLNYQAASYHDIVALHQTLGCRPAREFEDWLEEMGIYQDGKITPKMGDPSIFSQKRKGE